MCGGGTGGRTGHGGSDRLIGGLGSDVLNGGAGDDLMIGGDGDDYYAIDSRGDRAVEAADGSVDTISTTFARHVLSDRFENMSFVTGADVVATGCANADATLMIGGRGA